MSVQIVDVPVGTTARMTGPSGGSMTYRNEADLRDALAAQFWLDGWDVETEVATATGGRADIVARTDGFTICVEVKVDLTTQRQLRLGFQQADGYGRYFSAAENGIVIPVLTAAHIDWDVADPIDDLYGSVVLRRITDASGIGVQWNVAGRLRVATHRKRSIAHVQQIATDRRLAIASRHRRVHLNAMHRNYPATAETLAGALGMTFRTAA